jgi:hypothetical protein
MKLLILIILALVFVNISPIENAKELIENYKKQQAMGGGMGMGQPRGGGGGQMNLIYLYMKRNIRYDIGYYPKLFNEYYSTAGVKVNFVNIHDNILMGVLPEGYFPNISDLKETFEDILDDVQYGR